MMDTQKGLQNVIDELFSEAEHRFCVRYMYMVFKSKIFKNYLWCATNKPPLLTSNIRCKNFVNLAKRHINGLFSVQSMSDILHNKFMQSVQQDFLNTLQSDREKMIL